MIRREKYLKTASRLRQVVVKQGQQINANTSMKDSLDEKIEALQKKLASLEDYGQRAFAQPAFA